MPDEPPPATAARSCAPRTWCLSDSDGIAAGVLPIWFRVPARAAWHEAVTLALPLTNRTAESNFCDMSPSNRHPMRIVHEAMRSSGADHLTRHVDAASTASDLVNVDYLYLAA